MIRFYLKQNEMDADMLDLFQDGYRRSKNMYATVHIDLLWDDKYMIERIKGGDTIEIHAYIPTETDNDTPIR